MSKTIKLKKGYDIKLVGEAQQQVVAASMPKTFAIKPQEFRHTKFKVVVEVGTEVKAGSPLMYDKAHPDLQITSPVSGEVVEVRRGDKRVLEAIVILADGKTEYVDFGATNPNQLSAEDIKAKLLASGAWAFLRQRPYNVLANPDELPKSVFISGFDTAPLAPSVDFAIAGEAAAFQAGIDAIKKMTGVNIHLNLHSSKSKSEVLTQAKNVTINKIEGQHPAGNVGVQIHHLDAIKKGERVWHIHPCDVVIIGRLFLTGKLDMARVIAATGSEFEKPQYYKTIVGAQLSSVVNGNLKPGKVRIITGNVLTGTQSSADGFLGFYDQQITAIPEGDDLEFLGWLVPSYPRPDISKSFLSGWFKNRTYKANTNMHGEERAFVVTGQYEEVLPMDILPTFLLKSIIYKDIEEMEELGIYEIAEEDMALCEFVCTSKIPVQKIIREGLDLMYQEEQ
ncbi:MAG: Na(+)-translocating NADH-quinone reductase subunit A [Sphingobacteriaceae bacterium]|nr:Na(+)-translocating NADH-quinone reductase subunit A [Sphingobacteriaceae bacterium]